MKLVRFMAGVLAVMGVVAGARAQTYHVVELGAPGEIGDADAFDVKGGGPTIVGFSTAHDRHHIAFVSKGGSFTPILPITGDTESVAYGVDGDGRTIGMFYTLGDPTVRAFRWDHGAVTLLGDFTPRGVNAAGDICGIMAVMTGAGMRVEHACVLPFGAAAPTDLGTMYSADSSYAYAMNGLGQIVGQTGAAATGASAGTAHAAMWWQGAWTDLGTLGGASSGAYAVNEAGSVAVGWSDVGGAAPTNHAARFVLNPDGTVAGRVDMGVLPPSAGGGGTWSYAYDVNNAGWVVGQSSGRAFVDLGTGMLDLGTLLPPWLQWSLVSAKSIDEGGRIAAWGVDWTARPRPILLVPCHADVDRDGALTIQDIFEFLNLWFAQDPRGDFNRFNGLDVQDIFDFLSSWFGGCAA